MEFDGDSSDLDSLGGFFDRVVMKAVEQEFAACMWDGAARAKQAPFKDQTKALRGSIVHGTEGKLSDGQIEGFIGAEAPHAIFVEHDTKAHDIVPKSRRAKGSKGAKTKRKNRMLRFEIGGDEIFRRKVHHPGTDGMHFIETSMTEEEVGVRINKVVEAKLDTRRP